MKKHFKLHRHKDTHHKHSSKSKHRHKHKKEHPASEIVLEPIQEVSKEKVKIDKNACGDFANSALVKQFENGQKRKLKRGREKSLKTEKVEKFDQKEINNIFSRNYLQKLREPTDQKLVRHHSLEKSGDSLINRTKNLFRKEKSFNDAIQKVSVDLEVTKENKRDRKRPNKSGKNERSEELKEMRKQHKSREQTSKKEDKEHKKDKEAKGKKSSKKRARSHEKSVSDGKQVYSRVQEVIYCQLEQVPYKLKNDKSGAEIKDLYQRIKSERSRCKEKGKISKDKDRSHSHKDGNKKHLERERSYQSHHSPFVGRMEINEEKRNERSKSRPKQKHEEHTGKEERKPDTRSRGHRNHAIRHTIDQSLFEGEKITTVVKRKKDSVSNINLGPYNKYFAFENDNTVEHHHKKHHKQNKEHKNDIESSRNKKNNQNQLEYNNANSKRTCAKHEVKREQMHESLQTDEEKIHQIVEGDLETYFCKVQQMIDQKLDAILQISRRRDEKSISKHKKEEEKRTRSKSRKKETKSEKEEQSGSKKQDKDKKVDKSKHICSQVKGGNIKEEIIQEVLNRIKPDTRRESGDKEKRSITKPDKEVDTKHDSKDKAHSSAKKQKNETSDQKIEGNYSRSQDLAYIQNSSSKRHRERSKNLVHRDFSLPCRSTDRKQIYEKAKNFPDKRMRSEECDDNAISPHNHEKGAPRSPDHIFCSRDTSANLHDLHFRKLLNKKQDSAEKRILPQDSLVCTRNRNSSPPELVIPAADITSLEWETYLRSRRRHKTPYKHVMTARGEFSHHSLRKHYTSASSCRACSEHHVGLSVESTVPEHRSEQVVMHGYDQKHVASDKVQKSHPEDKKRSSPQEMPVAMRVLRERLVHDEPEDYIMPPQGPRKPRDIKENLFVQKNHQELASHRRNIHPSNHNIIILPPEMFRTQVGNFDGPSQRKCDHERFRSRERLHPKQEFLVQGIEPPILECPGKKLVKKMRNRNLECKTVSIVGIPPQISIKVHPITNQTQTSSRSEKSPTPDRDLVEKRKYSKRFKLYYKYSVVNNIKDDKESGTSEAQSIVSDSYRVISDPSDEERALVCHTRDIKLTKEEHVSSKLPQVMNEAQKKWNRIDTSKDSHLNNIIEEPSNISNSLKNDEYFIPIKGTKECYFRVLTSSHSEYCFKINKKPANSNISIVSKGTCDGRDGKCRFCKHNDRSKSDFNINTKGYGIQMFRSKSDVFLNGASGKSVIRSVFLDSTHPYVRSRKSKTDYKQHVLPQNVNTDTKRNVVASTACKDCQTSDIKITSDGDVMDEMESNLVFEDKQKQFKDIYKTIDDLEENIHSSVQAPPTTLDVAVSSKFLSLDKISGKKSQFKEIYKTIDNLQNKMVDTSNKELVKTVDVAIGSAIKIDRSQRSSRNEPRKKTREIAIGDSKDRVAMDPKTVKPRSESRNTRVKSTGVSPIQIPKDSQDSSRSATRKGVTPISPYVARSPTRKPAKNIRDHSPLKNAAPTVADTKKEPTYPASIKPKILVVKNAKVKSPQRTAIESEHHKNVKQDVALPVPGIKVFRSNETRVQLKKSDASVQNQSKDRKQHENVINTVTDTNTIHQKDEKGTKGPCLILNVQEDAKPTITGRTNNTQISSVRKYPAKEKGDASKKLPFRNNVNDLHKSCVHHYHPRDQNVQKSSRASTAVGKTPEATANNPVTVNTALFKFRPSSPKKCIPSEGSTSSSLGDDSVQNIKRSKSLVEIRTNRKSVKRSKSEIIDAEKPLVTRKSSGLETSVGGSVINGNMEKFTNVPRLRCHSSKSNLHSLDQFVGSKFTSRLLLTKDYKAGEISAYQRRKLYDQSIRQKMKKKFRFSKLDVGPQIFEVRFLSMVSREDDQKKEKGPRVRHSSDRPMFTLNLEQVKTDCCLYQKDTLNLNKPNTNGQNGKARDVVDSENNLKIKSDTIIAKKKSDPSIIVKNLKSTNGEQPTPNKQKVEDSFNCCDDLIANNIKGYINDKSVTQLYFKDKKTNQDKLMSFCNKILEVNSSLELPEEFKGAQCSCSKFSENCQSCKNFVYLMDILCSSMASYCDSKMEMIDFKLEGDSKITILENCNQLGHNSFDKDVIVSHNDEFDNLHSNFPNLEVQQVPDKVQEIFSGSGKNSSGDSHTSTNHTDQIFKNLVECVSLATTSKSDNAPSLSHPVSCPILPANSSSFDFLYEEASLSDNEDFTRDIVLQNLTRPFDQTFNFRMSQHNVETPFFPRNSCFSAAGSSESGYASIKSKSCKGNSLTNFFKKPNIVALFKPPVVIRKKTEVSKFCEQKSHGEMKKSILYEKMTKSCQFYAKKVRERSEMKLAEDVNEYKEYSLSFLLGQNSSAVLESTALTRQSRINDEFVSNEGIEFNEDIQSEREEGVGNNSDCLENENFVENGCRLVLSNECLKINSITYLGAEIFNEDSSEPKSKTAEQPENDFIAEESKQNCDNISFEDSSFTLDFSLDSTNPFVPSKSSLSRKFFESLLKVYDSEMKICKELFENDDFLKKVLLPAIEERKNEEKRSKKRKFSRFFRKKLQGSQTTIQEHKCEQMDKALTKIQNLASNAKKCFTMLAEAVKINENIDDEIKICGLLKLLERIESGDFHMIKNDGDSNVELDVKSQVTEAFINLYELCEKEAKKAKRSIGDREIDLMKVFVSKYRIGLLPKTDIVTSYIGRGVIQTEAQLKAAVTYLMRSYSNEVNTKEFDEYCNFNKSEKY